MIPQSHNHKRAHNVFPVCPAPNLLSYCGPARQDDLRSYVTTGQADEGLTEILNHFETLYPQLLLIAQANGLSDPYDIRVVEAYWLGNRLLNRIKPKYYRDLLRESLKLHKKIKPGKFSGFDTVMGMGFPNHAFHVLNIFSVPGIYRSTIRSDYGSLPDKLG